MDGWRGLCAITVALYHLNVYGHFYAVSLLRHSWLLVDFFFVLSGFVITHAYMDCLRGWADARAFMVRRLGRLWPLHITVLAFLVGLEIVKALMAKSGAVETVPAFSGAHSISSMCANIVLIHGLGLYHQFTWNVASWSISTEFYTYIVFACVLLLTRSLAVPLMATLVLLLVSVAVDLRGESVPPVLAFAETVHGFFLGHLAYRLWRTGFGGKVFRIRRCGTLFELIAIASVLGLLFLLPASDHLLWSFISEILFAFVVWVFAHEHGQVSVLIKSRPIAALGEWSYSIYMVRGSIILLLNRTVEVLQHRTATLLSIDMVLPWKTGPVHLIFIGNMWLMDGLAATYLIAAVLLASFTYRYVEQPGRRYFNSLGWAQSGKIRAAERAEPPALEADMLGA